jgi:hypothetical protein
MDLPIKCVNQYGNPYKYKLTSKQKEKIREGFNQQRPECLKHCYAIKCRCPIAILDDSNIEIIIWKRIGKEIIISFRYYFTCTKCKIKYVIDCRGNKIQI